MVEAINEAGQNVFYITLAANAFVLLAGFVLGFVVGLKAKLANKYYLLHEETFKGPKD